MERSLEVRWFFKNNPFRLFDFYHSIVKPHISLDWYLYSTPGNCMSEIKLRKSLIETKFLLKNCGTSSFGPSEGNIEEWAKWSVHLNGSEMPSSMLLNSTGWFPVKKTRYFKFFKIHKGSITEVKDWQNNVPENATRFEFTELFVEDMIWWTIGFKSFGSKDEQLSNLKLAVNLIFAQVNPALVSKLQEFNSFSYSKWLQQI